MKIKIILRFENNKPEILSAFKREPKAISHNNAKKSFLKESQIITMKSYQMTMRNLKWLKSKKMGDKS